MRRMADASREDNIRDAHQLSALMESLNNFPGPTIAKIQGTVMGGGVGLVACCDIAIASDNAFFALSEVRLGLAPAVISPYVIAKIGVSQARRYFVSAERFRRFAQPLLIWCMRWCWRPNSMPKLSR